MFQSSQYNKEIMNLNKVFEFEGNKVQNKEIE